MRAGEMEQFVTVMKALSDPNRVKILKMLQKRSLCVCELQAALNLAQPTVSKHLKVLEGAELVTFEKDGLWVNYQLSAGDGSPFAATMLGNLRHWLNRDPEVIRMYEALPGIQRGAICRK